MANRDSRANLSPCLEELEARLLLAVGEPSIYDQYLLELINRARSDPAAEAARLGISLQEGLPAGVTISTASKQPLAFNTDLLEAAQGHTLWMIENESFQHNEGSQTPLQRVTAAGYDPTTFDENLGVIEQADGFPDPLTGTEDLHRQIFLDSATLGRTQRRALMDDDFREAGVGVLAGAVTGGSAIAATEDLAARSGDAFLTGVVYSNALVLLDDFYTPGEGLGGVTVTASRVGGGAFTTTTWDSGGYSLALAAGTYDVTFTGGGLTGIYQVNDVVIANKNVKQDLALDDPPAAADLTVLDTPTKEQIIYARPGEAFEITSAIRNTGTARAEGPFNVTVYQSDDATVDTGDLAVDTYAIDALNASATDSSDRTLVAPLAAETYYLAVHADDGDAVAEGSETNNWGTVITLHVGEPDLTVALEPAALPAIVVPGDSYRVDVTVTNSGMIEASGKITTELYAAVGLAPGAGDQLLATVAGKSVKLAPGEATTLKVKIAITDALPQGTWHLLAATDTTDAIAEGDETNNFIATAGTFEQAWRFGTFADRRGAKLVVHDALGTEVTFSARGDGWGDVTLVAAWFDVTLHETDGKSSVKVAARKAGTDLHDVTVSGTLGGFAAAAALGGTFDAGGGIGKLAMDSLQDAAILLHTDPLEMLDPHMAATISLGSVRNSRLDAGDEPVKSLTVTEWLDDAGPADTFAAVSVDKLTAKAKKGAATGDFEALMTVAGEVGNASISGAVRGQWDAASVASMRVGTMDNLVMNLTQLPDPRQEALGRLTVDEWMTDSRILSAGNVGKVALGAISGSDIFASVIPQPHALPDPATAFIGLPHARIDSVKVSGKVTDASGHSTIDSNIAAWDLGSVDLTNALASNVPPAAWGLAGHTLERYSYRETGLKYKWDADLSPVPNLPGGDFTVLLV